MNEMERNIGNRLKSLRTSRGLKLDEVAEITGVSKAMISQIERGKTVPSVTILWKLTKGLQVGFTFFLDDTKETVEIRKMEDIEPISDEDGMILYPFFPFESQSGTEIFMIKMAPNSQHSSSAHMVGLMEYITVIEGRLTLKVEDRIYQVEKGQSLRFRADVDHCYMNQFADETIFQNIIINAL